MIKLGVCSVTFRHLSYSEVINLVKQSGLDGIEWGSDVHVPPTEEGKAEEVTLAMQNAGIETLSYGSYYRLGENADHCASFLHVVESAKALRVTVIRIWGGKKNRDQLTDQEYRELIQETLDIADIAKENGMKIAFEFHPNSLTNDCDSAIQLMEDLHHDAVGLYWQVILTQSVEENIANLQRVLPYLINVHVFNYKEKKQQLLDEYDGLVAWKQYVNIVKSDEKEHHFLLEFTKDKLPENFLHDAKVLIDLVR
ncbi:MAG TPA: hypothetical protein DCY74_01850 [Clostridiales bacterium]|mgnify:FL=1|jgi:sugar phosphate isomerase/epimerase|nr:hypothetical protein [Clostridiales bacterium]